MKIHIEKNSLIIVISGNDTKSGDIIPFSLAKKIRDFYSDEIY